MNSSKAIVHVISTTRLDCGGPSLSSTQLLESHRVAGQPGLLLCFDHQADTSRYASVSARVYKTVDSLMANESQGTIRAFHLHGIWDLFLHRVASYARRSNIPYVFSPRGMLEPWALSQKKWKKRLAWWLYQRRDLSRSAFLLATAQSEADQFPRLGLRNPTVVLPNGVAIPDKVPLRAAASSSDRTALFLSRIHPKKGLLVLAEAWAKVQPEGWRMVVVGPDEGGHRQQVESRIDQLGLRQCWEFRDAVFGEGKRRAFIDADLFILPTYSENFGIAVAEALAYGLPVITTTQAPWEGLLEHRCGWWVPVNVEGIGKALLEATRATSTELQEMGSRGQRWVRDEFAWPSIARRLIEAYEKYIP